MRQVACGGCVGRGWQFADCEGGEDARSVRANHIKSRALNSGKQLVSNSPRGGKMAWLTGAVIALLGRGHRTSPPGVGHEMGPQASPHRVDSANTSSIFAVACVQYLVLKGFRGTIVGQCGNRVVVAIGPAVGTFVFEIPREALQVALPASLPRLREKPVRRIVRVGVEGDVTVDDELYAELDVGASRVVNAWTEPVVT